MVGVGGWTKCKGGDIDKWQGKRVRDKSKISFLKVLLTWHYVTSTATSTVTGSHVGTHHSGDKLIKLAIDFCEPYVLDSFLTHTHQEQWSVTEGDFFFRRCFFSVWFIRTTVPSDKSVACNYPKQIMQTSLRWILFSSLHPLSQRTWNTWMQRDKQIQIVPVTICLIRIGALIPYQS